MTEVYICHREIDLGSHIVGVFSSMDALKHRFPFEWKIKTILKPTTWDKTHRRGWNYEELPTDDFYAIDTSQGYDQKYFTSCNEVESAV